MANREQLILALVAVSAALSAAALALAALTLRALRTVLGGAPAVDAGKIITLLVALRQHVASGFEFTRADLETIIRAINTEEGTVYPGKPQPPAMWRLLPWLRRRRLMHLVRRSEGAPDGG